MTKVKFGITICIILTFFMLNFVSAQSINFFPEADTSDISGVNRVDSVVILPAETVSGSTIINNKITQKSKSPTTAMLLSALLPGAGQAYNESYWKIPVILGLSGYWGYEYIQNNNEYKKYKNLYSESLIISPPSGTSRLRLLRDFYKDQRDKFAWYVGILYVVNIVDAYVDASLFEFSVSDDLSINDQGILAVKLKIYF